MIDLYTTHKQKILTANKISYYRFQPLYSDVDIRISSINKESIWMSDPEKFNDPLDLNLIIQDDIFKNAFSLESLKKAASILFNENIPLRELFDDELLNAIHLWIADTDNTSLVSAIKNRIRKYGVICLSPIWDNALMWAHYANNHQGFAVEYSTPASGWFLNEKNLTYGNVQYTTELPKICISEILFTPSKAMDKLLATKAIDWAYEREFRLICLNKKHQLIPTPDGMQISALIAGDKISDDNLRKLQEKSTELNVSWFKLRRKSHQYSYELSTEFQTIWHK